MRRMTLGVLAVALALPLAAQQRTASSTMLPQAPPSVVPPKVSTEPLLPQ